MAVACVPYGTGVFLDPNATLALDSKCTSPQVNAAVTEQLGAAMTEQLEKRSVSTAIVIGFVCVGAAGTG